MIYTIGRGHLTGHRIKSAVYFDLRLISTAGGGRPMLIAYKINKQTKTNPINMYNNGIIQRC
jgi:hypothetical protein